MKKRLSSWLDLEWYGWAALAFAVVVRLAFIVLPPAIDYGSGRRYVQPAADFLSGRFNSPYSIDQLPGAPIFFALCFLLMGGESYPLAAAAQHVLGFFSLVLVVLTARRAWGKRAASIAAVLLSLQLILAYQESFLLSETVSQFTCVAALFLAGELRRLDAPGWKLWALGGAAAAMSALSRGEFGPLGLVLAAALLLERPGAARARKLAVYLGAWLVLVGGWRLRNQALGYSGYNPHGMTVLLDSATDLVRYDLPTYPLEKQIIKEQVAYCRTHSCDPRPTTIDRLIREHGYGYVAAQKAFGDVAWEAISTQPLRLLPMFLQNFRDYFIPFPWVSADEAEPRSVIRRAREQGPAEDRFFGLLEAFGQDTGWLPVALCWLLPLALWLSPRGKRFDWTASLWLLSALVIAAVASIFRTVARTQAELYLPLCAVAAFSADRLLDATRKARRS